MDRRSTERLDLQLVCRVASAKALRASCTPKDQLMSENFSRNGILLRWLPTVKMPEIGSKLTVDVSLPCAPGAVPRAMRCNAQVVRIELRRDRHHLVGVTIGKIRFVQTDPAVWADLKSMRPASKHLN